MASTASLAGAPVASRGGNDVGFAVAIVLILCLFFLPVPAFVIDLGIAFSIALSVLILMVALWIQKPLEFSAFPTVLLVATILRLALNIATTRLILSHGAQGLTAAGYIIGGFANLVMGGDFVIGIIVFLILITINFLVITKGATRIAEVGARFTLDAIPGKQMAIDADLSAGLIDDKQAQNRRRELEEESSFFGSMDGASKFVRGDAIAGLIILAVNIFGGIVIGVTRHSLTLSSAADIFTKLSVGDGLVSQIPALIISLAAGLLVAKGGARGSTEKAVLGQLSNYPHALFLAAMLMFILGVVPGLPFTPFAVLGGVMAFVGYSIPKRQAKDLAAAAAEAAAREEKIRAEARGSVKEQLKAYEIELCLGRQLTSRFLASHDEIGSRVAKMRRKFARQYGFVVPEIKLSDDIKAPVKSYQIRIHGTVVATQEVRLGEFLVIVGDGKCPNVPGDEVREPAFGMKAMSIPDAFVNDVKRQGFNTVDTLSVLLTHLSEVIRNNLSQLLSYKDMRALLDRLDPEYKRLIDEICPSQISYSGLQAVLKLLLAERVSIRNLHLILEAIAEIAPHARRPEQVAEHVRIRISQQICGDLMHKGVLKVLRLGNRWDLVFHQSLKRDAKGDVVEFDIDPRLMEQFGAEASAAIRARMDAGHQFALIATSETRPYVRMIIERMFATLPVLSQLEIARGFDVELLGTIFLTNLASDLGLDAQAALGPHVVLGTFVLFCRVGACLMLMPGFSSPHIPVQIRLFLALALTLSLAPLLISRLPLEAFSEQPLTALRFIGAELLVGATIGMLGRLFLLALETLAMACALSIGLSNPFGIVGDESEPLPPIVSFITLSATALFFVMDLHWEVFRGIAASYDAIPVKENFDVDFSLLQFAKLLGDTFRISLRISAPFIFYAIITQFSVSLLNKLTPHIQVYFISAPFIICGGLFLTYFIIKAYLDQFMLGLSSWLATG